MGIAGLVELLLNVSKVQDVPHESKPKPKPTESSDETTKGKWMEEAEEPTPNSGPVPSSEPGAAAEVDLDMGGPHVRFAVKI